MGCGGGSRGAGAFIGPEGVGGGGLVEGRSTTINVAITVRRRNGGEGKRGSRGGGGGDCAISFSQGRGGGAAQGRQVGGGGAQSRRRRRLRFYWRKVEGGVGQDGLCCLAKRPIWAG
jgi:hypothetical protein